MVIFSGFPITKGYIRAIPIQMSAGPVTQVGTASSYCNMAIRIGGFDWTYNLQLIREVGRIVRLTCHFCHQEGGGVASTFDKTNVMKKKDFTTSISVDKTPSEVFAAINNVRGWWSENIKGDTDKVNGVFDYSYQDVHRCKIKVTELVPGKRVEWLVLDNYFKFTEDKSEWLNTKVI